MQISEAAESQNEESTAQTQQYVEEDGVVEFGEDDAF